LIDSKKISNADNRLHPVQPVPENWQKLRKKSSPHDGSPLQGLFEARRAGGFSIYFLVLFSRRGGVPSGMAAFISGFTAKDCERGGEPRTMDFFQNIQNQFFLYGKTQYSRLTGIFRSMFIRQNAIVHRMGNTS
jgi:hypothetical protein